MRQNPNERSEPSTKHLHELKRVKGGKNCGAGCGRVEVEARDGSLEVPSHRILVACSTLQVAIESIRDIENTLNVFHAERLLVVNGQGLRGSDCVLDLHIPVLAFSTTHEKKTYLSAIQAVSGKSIIIGLLERHRVNTFQYSDPLNEHLEDTLLSLGAQLSISQSDMDT